MKIEIANVQQKYTFFGISFYFFKNKHKQSGAAEACWAHNPEVRRSKLRSARQMFFDDAMYFLKIALCTVDLNNVASMVQW